MGVFIISVSVSLRCLLFQNRAPRYYLHLMHAKKHYFKSNNRSFRTYLCIQQHSDAITAGSGFRPTINSKYIKFALTDERREEAKKLSGIIREALFLFAR